MYYKHGPLARTEIGDLKVQGIDYPYTLQGWIKAVNANTLNPNNDMGNDGSNGFGKDAFGYSLHYNSNDYKAIGGSSSEQFLSAVASGASSADLFNGNISKMATAISGMADLTKTYQYDELNRLASSKTYENGSETHKYNTGYQYDANGNIKKLERNGNNSGNLAMDNLTYHYAQDGNGNTLNNRLLHVNDAVSAGDYDVDIDDQGTSYAQNNPATQNYKYDKIGNLISDKQEEIAEIVWNVQGKVQEIKRTANSDKPDLLFQYDAMGNRISKTVIYPNTIDDVKELTTYYVRDAQGNVMAVYEKKKKDNNIEELYLAEQYLYGSSRLGMRQTDLLLAKTNENIEFDLVKSGRVLGEKNYELNNHLGNVLAVVSDKKLAGNEADIVSTSDYYPFGMTMPGRSSNSTEYRYGYTGHEKDDEVSGTGNHLAFGDYGYDPRLGRRWRPDPKSTLLPHLTSYLYSLNSPLQVIDFDGEFPVLINGRVGNDSERASSTYWGSNVRSTISSRTGYKQSEFFYVDGDKGFWPGTRFNAGKAQAKTDAQYVWNRMKESMNEEGQITEQLQVITHSRGSAYGAGYMEGMRDEIKKLAKADGIGFAYDENSIVEYSVNLAPHQSNWINYEKSGSKNINISHIGDPLSGNDATGNVINVQSIPEQDAFDQHGNDTYNTELNFTLEILENGTSKESLYEAVKKGYQNYDNSRTNGDKSTVKK
jgi:HAMP domain-containing protein